jgi:hypothetical protein
VNHSQLALTAIDSLDALVIIGAQGLYEQLRDFVVHTFTCKQNRLLSLRDLCTHVIGGLVSAYSLTQDRKLLEKAEECGDVALSAFTGGSIPVPLVDGRRRRGQDYLWAPGIPLGEASSFLLEMKGLAVVSGRRRYGRHILPFLKEVEMVIQATHSIPLFLDHTGVRTGVSGLSPLNVAFIANLLRLQIIDPTPGKAQLIALVMAVFGERSMRVIAQVVNATSSRFDSSFCQLLPLFEAIPSTPKHIARKLIEKCSRFSDHILPVVSATLERHSLIVDEDGFQFDSSLLELGLLVERDFRALSFLDLLPKLECEGAVCGFHSQEAATVHDFMPPHAISKWLKLLYLDGVHLKYTSFVLNEVGHIIPGSKL